MIRTEPTPEEVEMVITEEDYQEDFQRGWTDDDTLKSVR
jgi:hypothetical protein